MKYFYSVFVILGFIFLRSGYGKVSEGKFVQSLPGTLEKFASNNPYPIVKTFLTTVAIPNSSLFGLLTQWGEVFTGLALIISGLYLFFVKKTARGIYILMSLGCFVGAFLNTTFYFSSGWTGASTESLNLVMALIEIIGLIFSLNKLSILRSKK